MYVVAKGHRSGGQARPGGFFICQRLYGKKTQTNEKICRSIKSNKLSNLEGAPVQNYNLLSTFIV